MDAELHTGNDDDSGSDPSNRNQASHSRSPLVEPTIDDKRAIRSTTHVDDFSLALNSTGSRAIRLGRRLGSSVHLKLFEDVDAVWLTPIAQRQELAPKSSQSSGKANPAETRL